MAFEEKNDEKSIKPNREIVVPGDILDIGEFRPGIGTYKEGSVIYSAQLGVKSVRSNYINVVPLSGRYIPRPGDMVIGKIIDTGPTNWLIDIKSPYPAPLHVNEVPWRVDFGDTTRYMEVGDIVLVKIHSVDEVKRIKVSMKGPGLKKLNGGQVVSISASKVPRVIGKNGSMISSIKKHTKCKMFVGQNGRIWIYGSLNEIQLATQVIKKIEREAHRVGLTEAIQQYLIEQRKIIDSNSDSANDSARTGEPSKEDLQEIEEYLPRDIVEE